MADCAHPTIATRDALLAGPPKRRYAVIGPLPVCGLTVRIRSLTEGELTRFQSRVAKTPQEAIRRFIAICLVDADGNPLLTDADIPRIAQWDAADTQFLQDACMGHVGVRSQDLESMAKNSAPTGDGEPLSG